VIETKRVLPMPEQEKRPGAGNVTVNSFGSAAIRLENVGKAEILGPEVTGSDIGIASVNSDLTVRNAKMRDVSLPFYIDGGKANVSHSQADFADEARGFQAAPKMATRIQSGYVRPTGPMLPCHCPNCNAIFPSRTFSIFNARIYVGPNNTETCPVCGFASAEIVIGLFEALNDVLKLLAGPAITAEMIRDLQAITTAVLGQEISIEEGVAKAVSIVPDAGKFFKRLWTVLSVIAVVTAISASVVTTLANWDLGVAKSKPAFPK